MIKWKLFIENEKIDEIWSKVTEKWKEICEFNPDLDIFKVEIAYYKNALNPRNIYIHLCLKEPHGHYVMFKTYYDEFIQLDSRHPKFYDVWDFWE